MMNADFMRGFYDSLGMEKLAEEVEEAEETVDEEGGEGGTEEEKEESKSEDRGVSDRGDTATIQTAAAASLTKNKKAVSRAKVKAILLRSSRTGNPTLGLVSGPKKKVGPVTVRPQVVKATAGKYPVTQMKISKKYKSGGATIEPFFTPGVGIKDTKSGRKLKGSHRLGVGFDTKHFSGEALKRDNNLAETTLSLAAHKRFGKGKKWQAKLALSGSHIKGDKNRVFDLRGRNTGRTSPFKGEAIGSLSYKF
jgi:hypothetical protein